MNGACVGPMREDAEMMAETRASARAVTLIAERARRERAARACLIVGSTVTLIVIVLTALHTGAAVAPA